MKKITFLTLMFTFSYMIGFSQLNPVTNIQWDHWYDYPHNYFGLTWDTPANSNDTLVGYKIYRDTSLYRFQSETYLTNYYYPVNCYDEFCWYNNGDPFYIYVTAIYNYDNLESEYLDSAYCTGYAVSIDEKRNNIFSIYPNPTTGKVIMQGGVIESIVINDINGKQIYTGKEDEIELSAQPKGIYIIKITTLKGVVVGKVILE